MKNDCRTCKHGDEPLNCKACKDCRAFENYEEDNMTEETMVNDREMELDLQLHEAQKRIKEQERRIRELEYMCARKDGMIDGLKFATRCNGVSGAEV